MVDFEIVNHVHMLSKELYLDNLFSGWRCYSATCYLTLGTISWFQKGYDIILP